MGEEKRGSLIQIQQVGLVTAEVYAEKGMFRVYLVGERLSIYLGGYDSLDECREDIESLTWLSQPPRFEQAVNAAVAVTGV